MFGLLGVAGAPRPPAVQTKNYQECPGDPPAILGILGFGLLGVARAFLVILGILGFWWVLILGNLGRASGLWSIGGTQPIEQATGCS